MGLGFVATVQSKRISRWRMGMLVLVVLMGATALTAVCVGTVPISLSEVMQIIWNLTQGNLQADNAGSLDTKTIVLLELRIPRLLMAMLIGMALAVSGATCQSMLRNPLADPYLLGISSGAAFGAVTALVFGWAPVPFAAFLGAFMSTAVVVVLASHQGNLHPHTLILAGVIVNAFLSALITLILTFSSAEEIQGVIFWLMGNVSTERMETLGIIAICMGTGVALIFWKARNLDLLAQGEPVAKQLGMDVERYKWFLMAITSFLTAMAVAYNGLIGFVGLIVPHLGRFLFGADNRLLIPASAMLGAIVMVGADTLARSVIAPSELPVGAVTALVGGPFFLILLRQARHRFV